MKIPNLSSIRHAHLFGWIPTQAKKSKCAGTIAAQVVKTLPLQTSARSRRASSGSNVLISERARCRSIISRGIKNGCINQAYALAFETSLTSDQAIAALMAAQLDAARPGSGQRNSMVRLAQVGSDLPPVTERIEATTQKIVNRVTAAAAKARGKPYNANETIGMEMDRAQRTHAGSTAAVVSAAAKARGEIKD